MNAEKLGVCTRKSSATNGRSRFFGADWAGSRSVKIILRYSVERARTVRGEGVKVEWGSGAQSRFVPAPAFAGTGSEMPAGDAVITIQL